MKYLYILIITSITLLSNDLTHIKITTHNNNINLELTFSETLDRKNIFQEKKSIKIQKVTPIKAIEKKLQANNATLYINSTHNTLHISINSLKSYSTEYKVQKNKIKISFNHLSNKQNFSTQYFIVITILCFLFYLLWRIKRYIPKKQNDMPIIKSHIIDSKTKLLCINLNNKQYIILDSPNSKILLDTIISPEDEK
ncbi:hypothetical protein CQA57_02090 [Helicobacter anseris]|uniref:Uncharacterized protein n=1 Tax=Helicobacter anseris TaxID=375926 RepID=A0A3D8J9W5_9HELI|nr:hypothetical protein [Helicobacter anseris]RDU74293.1 hypothetical protein CQA57_02090 [Helicobacter anseris]